jgi:membrane-bound lytic murein transglycosylase D
LAKLNLVIVLLAAAALSSCYTAEQRQVVTHPAPQAFAPQPLPVTPLPSGVRSLDDHPPDTVGLLIDQAEAYYAAGLNDYQSGNMEKAKENFDQAVATLLGSKMDMRGDDRLNEEFNILVDNINSVEMTAIGQGDALSSHRYEQPPIQSFSGLTFPVDPNVTRQAQEAVRSIHSDLPLVSNEYVDGVIAYMQAHARNYVQTVLRRLGRYGPMISSVLRQQGVPGDLIFIAAGESAFNPHALSNKGAKGMWQFMYGTGEMYGLHRDRWVDEREDPEKATLAAARLLKNLHQTFGDWFLAMAAYDSNPNTVQRAIEHTGYADYWMLRKLHALPQETENYVPVFLATALIAKDPKAFGFDVQPDPALAVDKVEVTSPTDLRLVAGLIDHPVDDLLKLNPSLLRWTTPAGASHFTLYLPAGTRDVYERRIAAVPPASRMWWRAVRVAPGDTMASVARKYRVTLASLSSANGLNARSPLEPGKHLVVPVSPARTAALDRGTRHYVLRRVHYRVKAGDNLELIADRFDVTAYQIRRWNHLRTAHVARGKTLVVYSRVPVQSRRMVKRRRPVRRTRTVARRRKTKTAPARTKLAKAKAAKAAPSPPSAR